MKKADMMTGVVLLALSGFVIQETWRMPASMTFGPGPAFLPFWLGVLLAIFATILIASAWRRQADEKENEPVFPGKQALWIIALVMVGLAGYIFLIEVLGYLLDTFLFILFLMKVVQKEKWLLTLIIALGTTATLFLTFQILLQIKLPSNMFGF